MTTMAHTTQVTIKKYLIMQGKAPKTSKSYTRNIQKFVFETYEEMKQEVQRCEKMGNATKIVKKDGFPTKIIIKYPDLPNTFAITEFSYQQ